MNPTNKLGMRVAAITAVVVAAVFGAYMGGKTLVQRYTADRQLAQASPSATPAVVDSDGDELADNFEAQYGTDPNNPDTDGDGMSDLNEVAQGSNPLVAGTQDAVSIPTGEEVPEVGLHTQRYLASLPADVPREEILNRERLEAYINVNKGPLLPTLPPGTVKTSPAAGKDAIEQYLHTISSSHNSSLHVITSDNIQQAFTKQLQLQPEAMTTIVAQLEANLRLLKDVPAPAEVAALHEKLVAASEALLSNTKQLHAIDNDFVGGLIASSNVQELGTVFTQITEDIRQLEAKYGLQ